jgi:hypothetical protein
MPGGFMPVGGFAQDPREVLPGSDTKPPAGFAPRREAHEYSTGCDGGQTLATVEFSLPRPRSDLETDADAEHPARHARLLSPPRRHSTRYAIDGQQRSRHIHPLSAPVLRAETAEDGRMPFGEPTMHQAIIVWDISSDINVSPTRAS